MAPFNAAWGWGEGKLRCMFVTWGSGFLYDGVGIDMRGACHATKCLGQQDKDQLPTGCLLSLAVFQSNLTPGTQAH